METPVLFWVTKLEQFWGRCWAHRARAASVDCSWSRRCLAVPQVSSGPGASRGNTGVSQARVRAAPRSVSCARRHPSGGGVGEGGKGMCRSRCHSLRMLFSGYKLAPRTEPGSMYSLHVWQCWFRCLLQIPTGLLPTGIWLLLHSSSGTPRCIFAVVQQAHPFCFAPSVSRQRVFLA